MCEVAIVSTVLKQGRFWATYVNGSESFSLLICLDTTKFVLLSVFTLKETICYKICSKSWPQIAKSPLPVDVCLSKTSLLKLLFPVPMSMKLLYPRERCFLSCSCTNGTAEKASVSNDGVRQCILCLFTHCFDKWIYLQAFEYSLKIIKARVSDQDPKVKSVLSFFF